MKIYRQLEDCLASRSFAELANLVEAAAREKDGLADDEWSELLHFLAMSHGVMSMEARRAGDAALAERHLLKAETAYREGLSLPNANWTLSVSLANLLLDHGRDPAECIALLEEEPALGAAADPEESMFEHAFEHTRVMLLAVCRTIRGNLEAAAREFQSALSDEAKKRVQGPDLSPFRHLKTYGVRLPADFLAPIVSEIRRFSRYDQASLDFIEGLGS